MVVVARDVRNPNDGPAILLWVKGSWIFFRLTNARTMITMAMVIRSTPGLAEFNARTPMGVAANPPRTKPILGRSSKWRQFRTKTVANIRPIRLLITTTTCWGSRYSRSTGAATRAKPNPTVPMTTEEAAMASIAKKSS